MLHILISSPYMCDFQSVLRIIGKDDELLLLSDGIVAGIIGSFACKCLMMLKTSIYVVENDVVNRSLLDCISKRICIVSYLGFVKLTEKHSLCLSW